MQRGPFRMPVQWVNRPSPDFRGYAGTIASGVVKLGDPVTVAPSGYRTHVERIVTYDGDAQEAVAGQSVTVTLADELDVTRGDMIADPPSPQESRISSRHQSSGWASSRCCAAVDISFRSHTGPFPPRWRR